jgi:hypothetical protein
VNTLSEQLKEAMIELAKCKAVLKLMNDRAGFAIEYAEASEGDPAIIRGMVAQFLAQQKDAAPCLD